MHFFNFMDCLFKNRQPDIINSKYTENILSEFFKKISSKLSVCLSLSDYVRSHARATNSSTFVYQDFSAFSEEVLSEPVLSDCTEPNKLI